MGLHPNTGPLFRGLFSQVRTPRPANRLAMAIQAMALGLTSLGTMNHLAIKARLSEWKRKAIPTGLILLLTVLSFSLTSFNLTGAAARTITPYPTAGETEGSKDTLFEEAALTQTAPEYADPYNHRDFNQPPPTVGGSVYYLPPGVPGQGGRIHSNYTLNTDACAACHFTHTALGPRLLQWPSAYEACVACHDGTMGNYTYDVFSGKIGESGKRTAGGLFGDNIHIANINNPVLNPDTLSNHMPDGSVSLAAAWGGDPNANQDEPLECISCHTPHGQGGNARILNPDPNKLLFKQAKEDPNAFLWWLEPRGDGSFQAAQGNWIPGYPYNHLTKIIVQYYAHDDPLLPPGETWEGDPYLYWSESGTLEVRGGFFLEPDDYRIDFRDGLVTLTEPGLAKKGNREVFALAVPGIYVVVRIENYLDLYEEKVTYLARDSRGRPASLNAFCGACHTDYNTEHFMSYNPASGRVEPHGSGSHPTGKYSQAYRHQVGNRWVDEDWGPEPTPDVLKFSLDGADKIVTCLTCHVAHGVDKEYWNDTNDSYEGFPDNVVDVNPSSALKRLPNMAVCEACHQMGKANQVYAP